MFIRYDDLSSVQWVPAGLEGPTGATGPASGTTQNIQSSAYTTVLSDAGKSVLHPAADTTARSWTLDSNANVAYPVGTQIVFINQNGAGAITISITADTMRLAGSGTTGSRTLAANGLVHAFLRNLVRDER
jgi:hypothetical protein